MPAIWLEVSEGVRRNAVDADLEVEMVAVATAGAADQADHITLRYGAGE